MPSPFPGMDPYLEHPDLWPDVHNGLIAATRDALAPVLRPHYYVAIEERTYLDEPPDIALVGRADVAVVSRGAEAEWTQVAPSHHAAVLEVVLPMASPVRETYLEVRGASEGDVVCVIEILSPSNKRTGSGRRVYLEKRRNVLATLTSLVEIDLLRAGERMPLAGPGVISDYQILVSRARTRPRADLIAFGLRDVIPDVPLPLRPGEEGPPVKLQEILTGLYDRASYDLRVEYRGASAPPLTEADAAWAEVLLRDRGLKG